jgi:hypothetical protein
MLLLLVILVSFGLAAFTYLGVERLGWRGWIPLICRGTAWTALGLLLVNVSCPVPTGPLRPLTLLDASLSMDAAGAHWRAARDSAARSGEVRLFGDERAGVDSSPIRGQSRLRPALLAAAASDRPLVVVTDGEIDDVREIPPDLLARSTVRVFPRTRVPDLAITRVSGPARVSAGDSIPLEVEVQASGGFAADSARLAVLAGDRRLGQKTVRLLGEAGGKTRIIVPSVTLGSGDQLLRVMLVGSADAERRTDTRIHHVRVAATPGVVFLTSPVDWDSRFLFRTLRDVVQLPIRGYARFEGNRWRNMTDLRPVPAEVVQRAARRADLLIVKGAMGGLAQGTGARGIWSWPSGESGETQLTGDWYLAPSGASPLAGAFLGQPVDSFPPSILLTPIQTTPRDWVALHAQLGRRGPERPAVFGRQEGRTRRVTVAVEGLWRWPFRGGASEQSYRSLVAATASWLLGGADSSEGAARPVRAVVPNGRPVVFEWLGSGPATSQAIRWVRGTEQHSDTLRFSGAGRADVWLPPGEYRYILPSGGAGTVAVEQYSDEFLPRPVSLAPRDGRATRSPGRSTARDWLWLFAICVVALSGEWLARRRLGLR